MNHLTKSQQKGPSRIAFMPIRPVFAERILSGEKLFEFRRTLIRDDVTHLIVYSSSPIKRIVGVAEVATVTTASPTAIWERTKRAAGISRRLFREYFRGTKKACAIEVKTVATLRRPLRPVEIRHDFKVPQSFAYVDEAFLNKVIHLGMLKNQSDFLREIRTGVKHGKSQEEQ